jgi:hypothetical protein
LRVVGRFSCTVVLVDRQHVAVGINNLGFCRGWVFSGVGVDRQGGKQSKGKFLVRSKSPVHLLTFEQQEHAHQRNQGIGR